jgi:hypothetical protein
MNEKGEWKKEKTIPKMVCKKKLLMQKEVAHSYTEHVSGLK